MKYFLLTIACILCFLCVKGQVADDTIYLNKNWKKTSKDSSSYCRLVHKQGKLFEVADYYKNGRLQMTGTYASLDPEMKDGKFTYYSENGIITSENNYRKNKLDGEYRSYYDSGKLWLLEQYKMGKRNKEFIVFYENGNIRRKDLYKNGEFKSGNCYTLDGKDTAYYVFEQMPSFPGGQTGLLSYIVQHTIYPLDAKVGNQEGTVYVQFVVNKIGNIEQVKVLRSVYPSLDAEALRVVESMPSWQPGQQDGKPVSVYYTVPIHFMLQ